MAKSHFTVWFTVDRSLLEGLGLGGRDALDDTENTFQCSRLSLVILAISSLHPSRGTNCTPPDIQLRVAASLYPLIPKQPNHF